MKILIIEDNEELSQSLKTSLEKNGFAVDYITDGEAGKRRLDLYHKDYDILVVDLMLPGQNGFEIINHIRGQGIMLPVIVLTGQGSIEDKVKALNGGADDYLVKPFSFEELHARIRALLRRPTEVLPGVFEIQDLVLNPTTRRVTLKDKEIDLTLKEFMLLEFFMRNPDRVISREEIYDNLWDFASNSFSNVIDVYVKNLRHKLAVDNYDQLLETVRGVGYRFKTHL